MANLGDTTIYGDLNVINNENIQGNLNLVGSFGIGGYPTVSSLDVYGSQSTEPLIQSYFSSSANAGGIGLNGVTQSHTRYFINGTLKWQTRVRSTDVFSIYSFTSASDVVSVSTNGTLTATTFSGSGASLTSLNASNLSSGTVPDAQISGPYTGITNLTLSGYIDFGSTTSDKLKLYGTTYSIGIESGTLYYKTGSTHRFYTGTTNLAEITTSGLNLKSGSYTGNGSGLTTLNASNLSSGTVPDAQISGPYTGITTLTCTSTVQGTRFISTQATGTSPFSVASTTVNSNLNADMVDGYHVSTTANAANTIPVRDANGYLNVGWINTTSGSTTSAIARIYASNDTYIRYYTPGEFANQIKPYLESSTSYSIGGKFSLQYNSTTDALDFVYIG